ncbi:MAG: AzlC family ABC transporter permease [Acidimicrobiia bacterium]|nr:AzlC family ABC transporter permease [Acidimicrobiia bacterium]
MGGPQDTVRTAVLDGVRSVAPPLLGVAPFGLIFGVTAAGSSVGGGLGYGTSLIIFAGAAQLATVQLLTAGSAAAVVIATALVINARHLMYSVALAPHFREFPTGWRLLLPYILTDQAFAVSIIRYESVSDPLYRRWYYVGGAMTLWTTWQVTTAAGVILGASVPAAWSLDFAIPLVFLALLVPALRDHPGVAAAIVGGVVAVAAANVSYNLGLIIGAVCGIAAGVIVERVTT